jgi:hypothetical protein
MTGFSERLLNQRLERIQPCKHAACIVGTARANGDRIDARDHVLFVAAMTGFVECKSGTAAVAFTR